MNNVVYGKTIKNLRKRIKRRVVKTSQDFIKYTSRPTCVNQKVFENTLAAIHEKKISLNYYSLTPIVYVTNYMKNIHTKKCTSTKNYLI